MLSLEAHQCRPENVMHTLGIVPELKGREAHFQDLAYVLVLKGVGPSEELLVQKERKYSIDTLNSGRRLHTIPYPYAPTKKVSSLS